MFKDTQRRPKIAGPHSPISIGILEPSNLGPAALQRSYKLTREASNSCHAGLSEQGLNSEIR